MYIARAWHVNTTVGAFHFYHPCPRVLKRSTPRLPRRTVAFCGARADDPGPAPASLREVHQELAVRAQPQARVEHHRPREVVRVRVPGRERRDVARCGRCVNTTHASDGRGPDALFSCGSSLRAVPMPTRIASCMVRILRVRGGRSRVVPRGRGQGAPVGHNEAFLPTQRELLPTRPCDLAVERLRKRQRHEGPRVPARQRRGLRAVPRVQREPRRRVRWRKEGVEQDLGRFWNGAVGRHGGYINASAAQRAGHRAAAQKAPGDATKRSHAHGPSIAGNHSHVISPAA